MNWVAVFAGVMGGAAAIVSTMIGLLSYFQRQAKERQAVLVHRLSEVERAHNELRIEVKEVRREMRDDYARSRELREFREDVHAQLGNFGKKLDGIRDDLSTINALIARLNAQWEMKGG